MKRSLIELLNLKHSYKLMPKTGPYSKVWYKEGTDIVHREDGPAVILLPGKGQSEDETARSWWIDGKLHRLDGPAMWQKDPNWCDWYENGVRAPVSSQKEFEYWRKLKAFW